MAFRGISHAGRGIGQGILQGIIAHENLVEQRKQREELARQFNEQQIENQRQYDIQAQYNQALLDREAMRDLEQSIASGTAGADLQQQRLQEIKKRQEEFAMMRKYGRPVGTTATPPGEIPREVTLPDQGITDQFGGLPSGPMSLPGGQFQGLPIGPTSPVGGAGTSDQSMRDVLSRIPGGADIAQSGARQIEYSRTRQAPPLPAPSAPQITTKAPTPLKAEDLDNVRQLKPAHASALANDSERLELFKRKPVEITGAIGIGLQQNMVDPAKVSGALRKISLGQELTEEDVKGLFREAPLTEEQKLKYAENGQRREAVLWTTYMQNQNALNDAIKNANIVDDKNVELFGTYQAANAQIPDKVMAAIHKRTNEARKAVEQISKTQETIKKQLSEEIGEDFQPAELDVEARTKESLKFFEARKKELIGNMQSEAAAKGAVLPPAQIEAEAAKQARLEGMERFDVDVAGLREPSPLDLAPPPTEDLDAQFAKFVNEAYQQTKDMTKAMEQAGQRLAAENPTSTDPRIINLRQGTTQGKPVVERPSTMVERVRQERNVRNEFIQRVEQIPENLSAGEKYREKEKILTEFESKYGEELVDDLGLRSMGPISKAIYKLFPK